MSKRAEAMWVALGLAGLACFYSFPLVFGLASRLPSDPGDPLLTTWTLAWDADRIRHGLAGIWDAPNFFPYHHTLLYSDHLLGLAVFTSPLQWLTGNPVLVYNVAFLASFLLSGGGMYLLARDLTGRADAALVAALAYACHPFRASHVAHLQWLMTGWLPLGLWALHRYFATGRPIFLTASTLFYLLQSLTATYFTYFALLPLGVVFVAGLWNTRPPPRTLLRHLAVPLLLSVVVMLPVVRAYSDVRSSYGLRRSAEEIALQSADVSDYVSAAPRLHVWGWLGSRGGEHELFPGAVTLGLALAALSAGLVSLVRRRQQPRAVSVYAAIGILAFLLSLGPAPAAWGHRLSIPGPYAALLAITPGLDGLRAVARLDVVVQTALAVLAGFGASLVSRHVPVFVLAIAIVAEGWASPIPTPSVDPHGPAHDREAYEFLRRLPSGAAIELPTSVTDTDPEFLYQYMTLLHHHPVVNGHSGYITPLLTFLGGGHSPLRDITHLGDAVAMFRAIGVRYVVMHAGMFASSDQALANAWRDALADPRQTVEMRQFHDITVTTLAVEDNQPMPKGILRIPASAIRATASQSEDRLKYLFDGDLDTRWLSGGSQHGGEWIDLHLDHPRNVAVVRLVLVERSFGDYPRDLAVDVSDEQGTRTLFRGAVLPQFARGLIANPVAPAIDVVLPDNRATSVRLRQLGTTSSFFWSIHELTLLERSI